MDPGLEAEQRGLEAIKALQTRGWKFNGFYIEKAARTYHHKDPAVSRLDSEEIDIIIVLGKRQHRYVLPLQIKSTRSAYRKFIENSFHRHNIMCVLIKADEPLRKTQKKIKSVLRLTLSSPKKRAKFLRPDIPINRL